jgi:protein-tyrosine-phosphatase
MAHAMLERMLRDRGVAARVRSAGIANWARDGMLPSLDARIAMRDLGIVLDEAQNASIDLRAHRDLVAAADVIVTMTAQQRDMLEPIEESRGKRILTLRELAGEAGDIADPAMQGEDVFRSCRDEIRRCLDRALDRLLALLG